MLTVEIRMGRLCVPVEKVILVMDLTVQVCTHKIFLSHTIVDHHQSHLFLKTAIKLVQFAVVVVKNNNYFSLK
jgi:hypothetical protein